MSFTDQKRRIATEEDCKGKWGFGKPGEKFRCHFCGHKFIPGDGWRWVYSGKYINFFTCDDCDGPDVKERWHKVWEELRSERFWWLEVGLK